ncbi:MAG: response regulator [Xanthomonadales bacterium]|nr:response regulator [Xanthomonadales bacterium]
MNVMIVDDQPSARTMLRHIVEGVGPVIRVSEFGNPVDALHWSDSNPTDLLLLDYRMPEMDGLEFTRRFRRPTSRRDIPIILISVVGDEPVRQAALDAGVTDFLVKPVRPRELRSRCRNLLQMRRQGEAVKDHARVLELKLAEGLQEIEQRETEILFRLAKAIEYRDYGASAHLVRMARYCELIAQGLQIGEDQVRLLVRAAPLHDIGKIGIPDSVLLKAGALSDEEMAVMRKHSLIGYEILRDSRSPIVQAGAQIALRHHERLDGSGYPDGLKGEQIPLFSRIAAIADVFDALTSERPYKRVWTIEDAFAYLQQHAGVLFDHAGVQVLLANEEKVRAIRDEKLLNSPAGF